MTADGRPLVLVTGAGGFIGWHVCKHLQEAGRFTVRAGVRRVESGGALHRLGLDPVVCDVTKPAEVERSVDGASHIVHCAKGGVPGVRNLLERAHRPGLERFVHISSVAAYSPPEGRITEEAPLRRNGRGYSGWKAHAERILGEHIAKGTPITILRPTIVYGPLNRNWTRAFARALVGGGWPIPRKFCNGRCNAVFVDDVVQAIGLALESDAAVGQAFNVNGHEQLTWNDYLEALASVLGLPRCRYSPKWTAALGLLPRAVWDRLPLVSLLSRNPDYAIEKIQRRLGYSPRFTLREGMAATRPWLEELGLASRD